MSVLIGHPTGTPNAHHAALSYYEAGRLAAFCVAWMPSPATLRILATVKPLKPMAERLSRRYFAPLARAPLRQGRLGEWRRLLARATGRGGDGLIAEANEWLMRTMSRACGDAAVSAVHAYEDCALSPFAEARRRGKACIYDMPTVYFPLRERLMAALERKYADWMAPGAAVPFASPAQKRQEMESADLVLAPCRFVADDIAEHFSDKRVALAPYGVDVAAWQFRERHAGEALTFLYAGRCAVNKGTPLLLNAWQAAGLKDARLLLVGTWALAEVKKKELPAGCTWTGPVSQARLREYYRDAGVLVFPTNFEGFGLVVAEALACGLPVLTTRGRGADGILEEGSGRTVPPDDLDALVEALRWFAGNRDRIPAMSRAARANAERWPWQRYRASVAAAVRDLI